MAAPSSEQRLALIVRGLEEVVAGDNHHELLDLLKSKAHPVIYWGTATTGKPHMGYFVPIYKISDFLAGTFVKSRSEKPCRFPSVSQTCLMLFPFSLPFRVR